MTAEQKARDMLARMEVRGAQNYSAGELVELSNLIADMEAVKRWQADGERIYGQGAASLNPLSLAFAIGAWWADRPWRNRGS